MKKQRQSGFYWVLDIRWGTQFPKWTIAEWNRKFGWRVCGDGYTQFLTYVLKPIIDYSMARPGKHDSDHFPFWKPQRHTVSVFRCGNTNKIYKALRNSSSAFIKRLDVRYFVFSRDNNSCVICGSKNKIQVDHIISVYKVSRNLNLLKMLNDKNNLRTLCYSCNAKISPND